MHILVVEDNLADARLVEDAIRDHDGAHRVSLVMDGRAALAFLHREEPYTGAPRPDVILLDLNLPYTHGRDVLAACKADPGLRHIPVIIWTSTQDNMEVRRGYELGAAVYCVKPYDLEGYLSLVQMIVELWGRRARLAEG